MPRWFVLVLLALAALPAAPARAAKPLALAVDVADCDTGAAAEDRTAVFSASMPADEDAVRLGMHFTLEERRSGALEFRRLKLPNFGVWQKSDAGANGYVVDKRVEQLAAGATYRVVVRFRWYAQDGDVVRTAKRTSAVCRQPDLRPDLRVRSVTVVPDGDGAVYRVAVRNDGLSAVLDPFVVTLTMDGKALTSGEPVPTLGAGAATVVSFSGPACASGTLLRASVDSLLKVDEADEADNVLTRTC